MSVTTVLVADDHPVVRQGLRALFQAAPDVEVIGEAEDGLQAVRAVERLKPHVLVIDVLMPGLNGLDVVREVARSRTPTRAVMLSMHDTPSYVEQALRNGASGYVLKDATDSELVHAVREVAAGRQYLSDSLAKPAGGTHASRIHDTAATSPYELLTTRERAVLQLTAEGRTAAEIGGMLFISPRTVETHRANLAQKLGLRTLSDMIRYAIRRGILAVDS